MSAPGAPTRLLSASELSGFLSPVALRNFHAALPFARASATLYKLPLALVCAVVHQESRWDNWAIRYEPEFYDSYVPAGLAATEARARAFSWGLMQVMGESARERGYADPLPRLCDPVVGLRVGCELLAHKIFTQAAGDITRGLLVWNGGGNPQYPADVEALAEQYSRLKELSE